MRALIVCKALMVALVAHAEQPATAASLSEPSGQASFSLTVTSSTPDHLERTYFALVPDGVAWRLPTAEVVGDGRQAALTLRVPAGDYRWVAGAPGLTLHFGEVTLATGSSHREAVGLELLVAIDGEVRSRNGRPVAGAMVGHLRALSDQLAGSLSPRARSLLMENFRAVTSESGVFSLPVTPGVRHFVWVEAPGFAPATLRDVHVGENGLAVAPIFMEPGGRLRATWKGKAQGDGVRLELRPTNTSWFDERGLKRGWILWDRVPQGAQQNWPALATGTYEIWAKGPSEGDHELLPQMLADGVTISRRTTTSVELELPTLDGLAASSGPSALVQVVSERDGRPVAEIDVMAVAEAEVEALMAALGRGRVSPDGVDSRKTDDEGWVRFPRMPVGVAHFVVITTEQSWPHISQALEFASGHELLVEIELPENGSIEVEPILGEDLRHEVVGVQVSIEDASGEHGKRWRSRSSMIATSRSVVFDNVPPGSWRVSAIVELHDGLKHASGSAEIELGSGGSEQVELDLEGVLFRGRVTYLGEPVVGAIQLRPVEIVDGQSVPRTYSDEEGTFVVPLVARGWYETSVSIDALSAMAELGPIYFDDPSVEIELVLPAGRISGRVVDGNGQPISAASVQGKAFGRATRGSGTNEKTLATGVQRIGTKSDVRGHFSFEMVTPGSWSLQAENAGHRSAVEEVVLSDSQEERTIEFVVEEEPLITGRLVNWSGLPLGGVRFGISPLATGGAMPARLGVTTDADGWFEIRAKDLVGQRANIAVGVAGSARLQEVHDAMEVVVPSQSGGVILRREQPWPRVVRPPLSYALVASDGAYFLLAPQSSMVRAPEGTPTIWELPRIAPGKWTLVHLESLSDHQALAAGAGGRLAHLARFDVVADSVVTVELR